MRVFPNSTRIAQTDEDDILGDSVIEAIGKYWYSNPVPSSHLQGLKDMAKAMDYRFQYCQQGADLVILRVPESEIDKLPDGDLGKYLTYNKGHGYAVYDQTPAYDKMVLYKDWKWA